MEVSSLTTRQTDDSYMSLLTRSFADRQDVTVYAHYFNFLHLHDEPAFDPIRVIPEENKIIPLRLYDTLQKYNIASSFDSVLPGVDVTIFASGVQWPTVKSCRSAIIINNEHHLRNANPRSLESADFVITTSDKMKDQLVNKFGIEPNDCIVIDIPPATTYDNKPVQSDIDVSAIMRKVNELLV